MTQEPIEPTNDEAAARAQVLVRRILRIGWVCVALAALFLYLSQAIDHTAGGSAHLAWASTLMFARLCGLISFAIGGIALYNHRWTEGVLLQLLSIVLPVVSFLVHGTI